MHLPTTLKEVGITEDIHFEEMAEKAANSIKGSYIPMDKDMIIRLYRACL